MSVDIRPIGVPIISAHPSDWKNTPNTPNTPHRGVATADDCSIKISLYETNNTPDDLREKISEPRNLRLLQRSRRPNTQVVVKRLMITPELQNKIYSDFKEKKFCVPPQNALWRETCSPIKGINDDYLLNIEPLRPLSTRNKVDASGSPLEPKEREKRIGTIEESHIVLLAETEDDIVGFATLTEIDEIDDKIIYVDLICSGVNKNKCRVGTLLLNAVHTFAQTIGYKAIELAALDYVVGSAKDCHDKSKNGNMKSLVGYYKRFGFETISNKAGEAEQKMRVETSKFKDNF